MSVGIVVAGWAAGYEGGWLMLIQVPRRTPPPDHVTYLVLSAMCASPRVGRFQRPEPGDDLG